MKKRRNETSDISDSEPDVDGDIFDILGQSLNTSRSKNKQRPSSSSNKVSMERTLKKRSRKSRSPKKHISQPQTPSASQRSQASSSSSTLSRRPRRLKPYEKQIKKLQCTTSLLIRKMPFQRLVREISKDVSRDLMFDVLDFRFQPLALEALQASAESYLTMMFENLNIVATHCRRVTILQRDVQLLKVLQTGVKLF